MIKANAKYTALEILTEAGFTKPEDLLGKFRVIIGGLQGIVTADHIVKIPTDTKELEVVVGIEVKTIKIKQESEDTEVSEGARIKLEAEGKINAEKAEHNQQVKEVARKIMQAHKEEVEFAPHGAEIELMPEAEALVEQYEQSK